MSTATSGPGWIAEVQGHCFDLAYWEQSLRRPFDPICERIPYGDSTVWALRSKTFDQLQTAEEVRDRATVLIDLLNGALSAQCGAEPLTLQRVARIDASGNLHFTHFAELHESMRLMETLTAEVRDMHGNLIAPPSPAASQAQRWVQAAERSNDVADMLIFAGRANNWFDIYKALELAQSLAGGRSGRKLNVLLGRANDEFERMQRTANMHRHARSKDPPPNPMALADAMSLLPFVIRTLLIHLVR
jgi:hypothetical protein